MEEMEILDIPRKVIVAKLLPYLRWNDLLRFRRVCKWFKAIADDYLREHPELAPEIEIIEEEGKTFGAFLKMGIPTTKIFLSNGYNFSYNDDLKEDADQFLEKFGPLVKHLRVLRISYILLGRELDFLLGFKNLESLEAHQFGGYRRTVMTPEEIEDDYFATRSLVLQDPRVSEDFLFPVNLLKNLKSLKIGNNIDKDPLSAKIYAFNDVFLDEGQQLESVTLPFNPEIDPPPPNYDLSAFQHHPMVLAFAQLTNKLQWQRYQGPAWENLKVIDFLNFPQRKVDSDEEHLIPLECYDGSCEFIYLACHCVGYGGNCKVKLMNIGSSWFMAMNTGFLSSLEVPVHFWNSGIPVYSMINLHPSCLSVEMANLERIEIKSTSKSSPGNNWRMKRPVWPSLKVLSIKVDSVEGECYLCVEDGQIQIQHVKRTSELLDFFFEDVSRTALTELRLEFSRDKRTLPYPRTKSIVSSCPNLKKLTIVNWPGSNRALTKLWSGLPGLEEVSLRYCRGLGDSAFIGEDVWFPVFLKLTKLKKLSLVGLHVMPKITDYLFALVIRHMELTHLELNASLALKSITVDGVESLKDGVFAKSIEKLSFNFFNWTGFGIPNEEFKDLEASFRSFNML